MPPYRLLLAVAGIALFGCRESETPSQPLTNEPSIGPLLAMVPSNFSDVQVVAGLTNPTLMAIAPDGRIFVSEQAGRVRVIKNGAVLTTPFVTLRVNARGERGARGPALDPAVSRTRVL